MIRFKKSVKLGRLQPELLAGMMIADQAYEAMRPGKAMWITSVNDSKHGFASLHLVGQACDIRAKDLTKAEANTLRDRIADRLNAEFDVVVEWDKMIKANCHVHLEWQPKK
jgi:hypothetical protein|tara:strand:- start:511 stop:843 length:333 start_codon:yes stop_codon:yes gene_type:complete